MRPALLLNADPPDGVKGSRVPISIEIEPVAGIAIISASGSLSREDAEEGATALWNAPEWSGEAAVWNFESARFDVSPAEARGLASFILRNQPSPPPRRMAFVTPHDVDFGMARVFQVFREESGTEFRVFRDPDEALAWALEGRTG